MIDFGKLRGNPEALKWNKRDLPLLDRVLARVPGRTCAVQAGGHLGVWPKRLAQEFATVYTFEPAADLFALLVHNAPEPNIFKYQAALGHVRELVGLSRVRRDGKPNTHEGITHVSGPGVIPTLQIDDLGLTTCDLICLDVEGSELPALLGATLTIDRCRPVLAVEVNKNAAFVGLTEEYIRESIRAMDYVHVDRLSKDDVWIPRERAA